MASVLRSEPPLTDRCAQAESHLAAAAHRLTEGDFEGAQALLGELDLSGVSSTLAARIANDRGVLATLAGDLPAAREHLSAALRLRPEWPVAARNLHRLSPARHPSAPDRSALESQRRTRVAIVSLLFNWPSSGGGTVHTAETARFLHRSGYEVRHLSIRFDPWGLGQVREPVDWPLRELNFAGEEWRLDRLQVRIQNELREFQPDAVIVTDSWSMKPRLAEACRGFPTYLRLAAQECLCPLTNVRLLGIHPRPVSCPRHQLATPEICRQCVRDRGAQSGSLHQAERLLAGFDSSDYTAALHRSFAEAAGVLVVNPLIAEMCKPYAQAVHVLPSGFDPDRFPWTTYRDGSSAVGQPLRILFAGLTNEAMKGFAVLRQAGRILWARRQDFRIVITADPEASEDSFCEFVGWQSQADLPAQMRQADLVVCPTIAEEALGRTAVEAMGAWRPVVASRIGGLPFTVLDEATGLLSHPGDAADLARQLERLLDDASLRERLGTAGRRRFEEAYVWPVILQHGYQPLLGPAIRTSQANEGAR